MKFTKHALAVILAISLLFGFHQVRREMAIRSLVSGGEDMRRSRPWTGEAERRAHYLRKRTLAHVWQSRHRQKVLPKIESYLQDRSWPIRVSAVRALGWLEEPSSVPALRKIEQRINSGQETQVGIETVKMAVGRIEARDLKGKYKLEKVAKSVGLSWQEVARLSQRVNAPASARDRYAVAGSSAVGIVRDFVDLLYEMGKQGQDIQPFAKQLTLLPSQQVYLNAANRTVEQEIDEILAYGLQPDRFGPITDGAEELLKDHLVGLGEPAADALIEKLQDVAEAPTKQFSNPDVQRGYVNLFRAVANLEDKRVIPLLKILSQSRHRWLSYYAAQSLSNMEQGLTSPAIPA